MDQISYRMRYHEALSKAFAARAPNVREAYLDLANFYRGKLDSRVNLYPSCDELRYCLARRRA